MDWFLNLFNLQYSMAFFKSTAIIITGRSYWIRYKLYSVTTISFSKRMRACMKGNSLVIKSCCRITAPIISIVWLSLVKCSGQIETLLYLSTFIDDIPYSINWCWSSRKSTSLQYDSQRDWFNLLYTEAVFWFPCYIHHQICWNEVLFYCPVLAPCSNTLF